MRRPASRSRPWTLLAAGALALCIGAPGAWAAGSALLEQVAPVPTPPVPPAPPPGAGDRAVPAPHGESWPAQTNPNKGPQTQIAPLHEAGPPKSVILPESAAPPRTSGAALVPQPEPRTQERVLVRPVPSDQTLPSGRKTLVPQPGKKLTGSEDKVLGKPAPELTPQEPKTPTPAKEVATPKTGADTAGRPVSDDGCRNRETAPGQPEATLVPPDRCGGRSQRIDPNVLSQRLGQAPADNTPQFSGDAASIGLVPGAGFPYGGSSVNPFLPLPQPKPGTPGTPGAGGLPGTGSGGAPPPTNP